jgi:Pectate lyase superfamily protein
MPEYPSSGGSAAPSVSAAVNVKSLYGVAGDGVTDDTAAIRNAINTEVANCQTNGTYFAKLYFPAGIYLVNGAYAQGGSTRGNAILPLPLIGVTGQKVTLVLEGAGDATGLPHWHQTVTQQNGTVFKTTRTDGTNDASGRTFADGVTTNNSAVVTSATAAFVATDVGRYVTGTGIPLGTWIASRQSATQVTLSQNATATATGVSITLSGFGEASILGGPTPAEGYGPTWSISDPLFSNMLLNLTGITFVAPANPTVSGVDARCLAEFNFATLAFQADQNPPTATIPAHTWQFGLGMPQTGNNDNCNGLWYSEEGAYFGILASEHTCIQSVRCIYSADGIFMQYGTGFHGAWIGYASIEACAVCLNVSASNTYSKIVIDVLDYEDGAGGFAPQAHIYDPGNRLYGSVGLQTNDAFAPVVTGAANLDVKSLQAGKGAVTPPAVPASTVTYQNVFWRDAAVTVTGGTVTAITVDGVVTGLTSGTVIVPSGKAISWTGTGAPTWKWWLL